MKGLAVAAALAVGLSASSTALFAQAPAQQAPAPRPAAPAPGAPTPVGPEPTPAPFPEGAKYAFINIQRIASESTEGKAATARVNALVTKKQAEGADRTKQLQAAQQKLDAGGTVLSEAARSQLQKEVDRLTVDIQRFNEDAQEEVQALQNELMAGFQEQLSPIIQQVATEKKLHMIFSTADAGLVWGDPGLDITADVIKRFDAAHPGGQTAAPAGAPAPRPAGAAAPRPAGPAAPAPRPAAPAAPAGR